MLETPGGSRGQEDSLEKEMGTHSNILAWKIPWTGSLAGSTPWVTKSQTRLSPHTHTYGMHLSSFTG